MASPHSALTGDAVADPGSLRMYLSYTRLRSRDLGSLYTGIARLYDQSVRAMSGHRYLVLTRGDQSFRVRPSLDVIESRTGNSIKLRFAEGWMPTLGVEEGEIAIGIPKKTALPLVAAYFLIQASAYTFDLQGKYLDIREKQLQIQLHQIELRLKQEELAKLLDNDKLHRHAAQVVDPVLSNELITSCQVNGVEIKPQ